MVRLHEPPQPCQDPFTLFSDFFSVAAATPCPSRAGPWPIPHSPLLVRPTIPSHPVPRAPQTPRLEAMCKPNTPAADEPDLDRRTGPDLRAAPRQPHGMERHRLGLRPPQLPRPPRDPLGVDPMAVRELRLRLPAAAPGF